MCLEESHGRPFWREEGSRRAVCLSGISCSKHKNGQYSWAYNQAKAIAGLHQRTRSPWQNSGIQRKHTRDGSLQEVEAYTSPWDLMRCTHNCWGSWLGYLTVRPLWIIFERSWWLQEDPEASKKANSTSSRAKGESRGLQAGQPHLGSWEGDGANNPRNSFQNY